MRLVIGPIGLVDVEEIGMLLEALPKEFKGSLPTIEEIEAELEKQEALIALHVAQLKKK